MAKKRKTKAAKRTRRKRVKVTPKLIAAVKKSILVAQKVVYKELVAEHKISVGTLHKILSELEKKGTVGTGGKGKVRSVLANADGSSKTTEQFAEEAPKPKTKRRRRRKSRKAAPKLASTAPASDAVLPKSRKHFTVDQKRDVLTRLAIATDGETSAVLASIGDDLAEVAWAHSVREFVNKK